MQLRCFIWQDGDTEMADNDYNVYKGADGQWRAKKQGNSKATVTGNTQKEVFDAARELAKKNGSEVAVHRGDNGKIRSKHSYGNDPEKTKG